MQAFYDTTVTSIEGATSRMDQFRGKVLLIVNVASRCGYTRQYVGLESMYRKSKDRGLVVLGFPCDQFGHQEPGTEAEIREFCSRKYDVTFPMFAKIKVNGHEAHALYRYLKSHRKGVFGLGRIKWNFSKFLVSRTGEVIGRYGPRDTPASIESDVESALSGV
jgi:glutathione peroxidase